MTLTDRILAALCVSAHTTEQLAAYGSAADVARALDRLLETDRARSTVDEHGELAYMATPLAQCAQAAALLRSELQMISAQVEGLARTLAELQAQRTAQLKRAR